MVVFYLRMQHESNNETVHYTVLVMLVVWMGIGKTTLYYCTGLAGNESKTI